MLAAVTAISGIIGKVIDKAVPDTTLANKIKAKANSELISLNHAELEQAGSIIQAEANGESWLQRNWRPLTMLTFTLLVVLHWLGVTDEQLSDEEAVALLDIVKIGLGGYVAGRSAEKALKIWKG